MPDVSFSFNGVEVTSRAGQSLAAALTSAGYRAFRRTAQGDDRGIFCGIGVCQDCLLTVDGVPNKRACMTKVADSITVTTQEAFPKLDPAAASTLAPPARLLTPDVLVIGGGAGGLSATIAARCAGAEVLTLDERNIGGGQYYKQTTGAPPLDAQQEEGADLVDTAHASGADIIGGVEIWGAFDGPLILAEAAGAALIVRPRTLIVATGAYERPIIVPGWTLPGVMTTGAAQALWRSYRTLPGRRVAVCGSGPLNLQVALELANGGAEIAIVAEAGMSPFLRPAAAARLAMAGPALAWKGFSLLRNLRRRNVPVRNRLRLSCIEGQAEGLRATFQNDNGQAHTIFADVVCMNGGFQPQNEMLRLLGAGMTWDPVTEQLRCDRSETLETSVPGVFAVGDCAGLGGAPAACLEGRIAGKAAAARTGHGDGYDLFADQRALCRHRRFQKALWRLHDTSSSPVADLPRHTILCRCEEITVGEALDGYEALSGHLGTLKRATRLGMGRCQGRYCGPAAAQMIAARTGAQIADRSFFAPRVPIKPVAINSILAAEDALRSDD